MGAVNGATWGLRSDVVAIDSGAVTVCKSRYVMHSHILKDSSDAAEKEPRLLRCIRIHCTSVHPDAEVC